MTGAGRFRGTAALAAQQLKPAYAGPAAGSPDRGGAVALD